MVRVPRGILLVLLVAVAACSDDDTADPAVTTEETTSTTVDSTTTTDPPPDPSVIPDDPEQIDEEYIEAVLTELESIEGDAFRALRAEGPTPEVSELVLAINTPDEGLDQINLLVDQYASGAFDDLAPVPGDVVDEVEAILVAGPECVSVEVTQDFTARGADAVAGVRTRIDLAPAIERDEANSTAWVFAGRYALGGTLTPPEPCAAS